MGFPDPKRSSFGVARINDRLIIIGGHKGMFHDYPKGNWSRDVQWVGTDGKLLQTLKEGFPEMVQGLRAVADGGDVIAFGGFIYDPSLDVGEGSIMFNWFARSICDVRVLKDGADHFETIRRMPKQRSSHVAERIGDLVYILGGWDGSTELRAGTKVDIDSSGRFHNTVDIFDCKSRDFVPNLIKFPDPLRRAFSSTVFEGKIVMAGGITPDYNGKPWITPLNTVTVFDSQLKTFNDNVIPALPRRVFAPSICAAGDNLVLIGGMDETPAMVSEDVWVYTKAAGRWMKNKTGVKRADCFVESFALDDKRLLVIGSHDVSTDGMPVGLWQELEIDPIP